jgi:hypothetical protein
MVPTITNSDCDESSLDLSQKSDLNTATLHNALEDTSNHLLDNKRVMISVFQFALLVFAVQNVKLMSATVLML